LYNIIALIMTFHAFMQCPWITCISTTALVPLPSLARPLLFLNEIPTARFMPFFLLFAVLGLELKAYTLSHSTSPFFVKGFFEIGSWEL
jgi:hypothetical protein